MTKLCTCPVAATIVTTHTAKPCPVNIGQIQRPIFWRKGNTIATEAAAALEATWDTLRAAVDSTKAMFAVMIGNPEFEVGPVKEFGSNNEVPNGIPFQMGSDMTKFMFRVYRHPQSVIALTKDFSCEDLEVIFVNEHGYLVHDMHADGVQVKGFDMEEFFLSDLKPGGFDSPDWNEGQFYMPPLWSDRATITVPTTAAAAVPADWDPRTKYNT